MNLVFQFLIILAVSFAGEVLHWLIPLPVPASIYGLALMLICLQAKIIRPQHVKRAGGFLLEIMPLLFVPAAVGVLTAWSELTSMLVPVLLAIVVITVIVMAVTGKSAQFLLTRSGRKDRP